MGCLNVPGKAGQDCKQCEHGGSQDAMGQGQLLRDARSPLIRFIPEGQG
jgi:hypothetical protein